MNINFMKLNEGQLCSLAHSSQKRKKNVFFSFVYNPKSEEVGVAWKKQIKNEAVISKAALTQDISCLVWSLSFHL